MAKLIAQTGHSFDIPAKGVTFGADPANDVMIPSEYGLAPSHFALWQDGETYMVRDSGSGRGLLVNGRAVQETRLQDGDTIDAGKLHLAFADTRPVAAPTFVPFKTQRPAKAERAVLAHTPLPGAAPVHSSAQAVVVTDWSPAARPAWTAAPVLPMAEFARSPAEWNWKDSPPPPAPVPVLERPFPLPETPRLPLPEAPSAPSAPPSWSLPTTPPTVPAPTPAAPFVAMQKLPAPLDPPPCVVPSPKLRFPVFSPQLDPPMPTGPTLLEPRSALPSLVKVEAAAEVKFEVLPAEHLLAPPPAEIPSLALAVSAPPQLEVPPPWFPTEMEAPQMSAVAPAPGALTGITDRKSWRSHREKVTICTLWRTLQYTLLTALLVGAATARHWCGPLAKQLETTFSTIFTNASAYDAHQSITTAPMDPALQAKRIAEQREEVMGTAVNTSKPHHEVVPRFLWEQATTLFSLGFPQIEIFYLNQAQQRGLPLPKRHCAYLEKNFGLRVGDLQRLTSIQVDSDHPGIVLITTLRDAHPTDWINEANLQKETPETVGPLQVLRYRTTEGRLCGVVAVDQRNFAMGDPALLAACLQRKTDPKANPTVAALWPDYLRKQPGAFLWTVKLDAGLQAQLNKESKLTGTETISSFAVRFGGEPPLCECFALRDAKSSQEAFANAATGTLRGMLRMMTSQIESGGTQRSGAREEPTVEVSRTAAVAPLRRGEEFVNIFLQGFYAAVMTDDGPLPSLAQARTMAHAFNLAKGFDAPESRRVRTVEQAMEALQRGMSGTGKAAAMEFQVQEMNVDELRRMRKYLTFADGYLACRPDLDSLPDPIRSLAEEGRNRLNAETVLSLCLPPSSDKVVKIKDLTDFIRKTLTQLKNSRGAMALFGMPQLTDDEIHGVLRYIQQLPNGKLGWKPGELSFIAWQAKSNPKAIRDAATLASLAGAARAAGATELTKAETVDKAVEILCAGIKGAGQFRGTMFKCQSLNPQELQSAAALLELDNGMLRLKSEVGQ